METTLNTFAELNLIAPLQLALNDEDYHTPTPIQAQAIPAALQDRDVLGCAQTGTGKTAAFALPILNRLGKKNRKAVPNQPFVLVLAPTRELAIQIGDSFETYGKHLMLRCALVYGGVNQSKQVRAMRRGSHILVATPGRLIDLMQQGHIELDRLEVFVLDEADRMLDMGFLPALKQIISQLPKQRQSLFFSATMPPKISDLSQQLLTSPVSVNVTPAKSTSVKLIAQQVMFVERTGKLKELRKLLATPEMERAIVFTRTKRGANALAKNLEKGGLNAAAIHGNKSQGARQRALENFRTKEVQVLVATDVVARGIDIDGVTHVVNYDLPIEPESYVHRIGRTGRAGAEGMALSFCTDEERSELRAIEKLIEMKIPLAPNQPKRTTPEPSEKAKGKPSRRRRPSRKPTVKKPVSKGAQEKKPSAKKASPKKSSRRKPASAQHASDATGESRKPKAKSRRRRKGPRKPSTNKNT